MCNKIKMYEFLKKQELGITFRHICYSEKKQLKTFVHIDFNDIKEFTDIIGSDYFDGCGHECVTLFDNRIVVELEDILEWLEMEVVDIINCFDKINQNIILQYLGRK